MALYHFSAKIIGRASGRSVVAAAAYRAATELEDERLGQSFDYSAKEGVIHSEIMLPEGAPARWKDRSTLWNEVEKGEKRKDAQLARDIEISLPREMDKADAVDLARDFVREQFVSRGMVADLNVHWTKAGDGEAQPHAHVLLTMREVVPGENGQTEEGRFGKKVTAWNDRALLGEWRERWASITNERLAELDIDVKVDHRSYAEQGINLEPQDKIGPAGARREKRGEEAERAAEHIGVARRNGERLAESPEIALDALTKQQSTFTRQDVARLVNRHTADAEQFADVMAKVEASPELVRLGEDERGRERLTTRAMLASERSMEQAAAGLKERQGHGVALDAGRISASLGDEQRQAFQHVTERGDLAVVVGYAGTGKSTMLGVARQAWEAGGYTVKGAALSGIAAEGLETGAGISSRTIHSLVYAWERGEDHLQSRDILVVDEAGMIGSRQMEKLLSAAHKSGAKVVLVGDPEQLQAIDAGGAFRAVAERAGAVEITEVRRQRDAWQQEATRELATGRTDAALNRYDAAGMMTGHADLAEAKAAIVAGWDAKRLDKPEASQIILTYRRDDVADLNNRARAVRREAGELGHDQTVSTERGERQFATGDRLYFLRNNRRMGVKNGTLGTIERLSGNQLTVRLDGPAGAGRGKIVDVDLAAYGHLDHGYAATIHKAQGVTVDHAHILASAPMDRHAAYVGLTRHRQDLSLHWSQDEIGGRDRLSRVLSRERLKDTSLDYELGQTAAAGRAKFRERFATHKQHEQARGERMKDAERNADLAQTAARREAERQKQAPAQPQRQGHRPQTRGEGMSM